MGSIATNLATAHEIKTLEDLDAYINERYTFTEEHYPAMQGMNEQQKKMFALNHGVLHMMKSLGKIAAECESYDHGDKRTIEQRPELAVALAKMIVNVLSMAHTLNIAPQQLYEMVPAVMKS